MRTSDLDADHLIIGAGVSGLTLAHQLAEALPADQRILLVDRDPDPDYNISFWTEDAPPFPEILGGSWRQIEVRLGPRRTRCPLERFRLYCFWRRDFDAHLQGLLDARPNVTWREADVLEVADAGDHARVQTAVGPLTASWVYDSRASLPALLEAGADPMLMQGLAVEIETETAVFDPEVATLFDFLLDSPNFDFIYLLPYGPRRALVNVAFVTPRERLVEPDDCRAVIDGYLRQRLGVDAYRIEKECFGRLPLADRFPERDRHSRVLPIGIRGGMIKSSTSYAYTRILADARAIARSMVETGRPHHRERSAWYYRAADRYTSEVFHRAPGLAQELMFGMFTPETGDLGLAFLDEANSLAENRRLFESVEPETLKRFLGELVVSAWR